MLILKTTLNFMFMIDSTMSSQFNTGTPTSPIQKAVFQYLFV